MSISKCNLRSMISRVPRAKRVAKSVEGPFAEGSAVYIYVAWHSALAAWRFWSRIRQSRPESFGEEGAIEDDSSSSQLLVGSIAVGLSSAPENLGQSEIYHIPSPPFYQVNPISLLWDSSVLAVDRVVISSTADIRFVTYHSSTQLSDAEVQP